MEGMAKKLSRTRLPGQRAIPAGVFSGEDINRYKVTDNYANK
jgi:hypothetical protein